MPSRSRSPDRLPHSASSISESDYFLKSAEFRVWLKDEKRKYLDEISSEKAHSYFRKFIKAWNKGKLSRSLYAGVDPSTTPANSQTAYKWSFASNKSRVDPVAIEAARAEVTAATYQKDSNYTTSASGSGRGRVLGPTMPSASDIVLAREAEEEERGHKRKRDRREAKDRLDEIVGPKEVGREGALETKRARREGDRAFREKKEGEDGLEMDEGKLLGGGDSFKEQLARRDAARKRFEEKKNGPREERLNATRERANAIKEKDRATMDMFQQMANQRFG